MPKGDEQEVKRGKKTMIIINNDVMIVIMNLVLSLICSALSSYFFNVVWQWVFFSGFRMTSCLP